MVSVAEHNRAWQMAMQVGFNTEKIVNQIQGPFGNKLLMQFLSAIEVANSRYSISLSSSQKASICNAVV